jgi:hypothetical protein
MKPEITFTCRNSNCSECNKGLDISGFAILGKNQTKKQKDIALSA